MVKYSYVILNNLSNTAWSRVDPYQLIVFFYCFIKIYTVSISTFNNIVFVYMITHPGAFGASTVRSGGAGGITARGQDI